MRSTPRYPAQLTALAVGTALAVTGCRATPTSSPTGVHAVTATPSATQAPVRAVDLATGEQPEAVEVLVDGGEAGVGVTFREITIEPGAGTGEHCHYGNLIAVVQEGALTHYAPVHPGGVRVYQAGDAVIEGAGYIHEGVNEGETDVVLWVTYVTPEGQPLAETDLQHCTD